MIQRKAEEFVRLWQTSENAWEIADKLGMSANAVYSYAARLRKRGVPLKRRNRGRLGHANDYAALIRLAQELEPDNV